MTRPDLPTRMAALTGRRRSASLLVAVVVVVALAIPAFAADPSGDPSTSPDASVTASESASAQPSATDVASPSTPPAAKPPKAVASGAPEPDESADTDENGAPDKTGKGNKGDGTPEVAITLRGTVAATTDAEGDAGFSMTSGATTYQLGAGPSWFWGANNPLAKFVGKTVTVVGETHTGTTDVDVLTVDGTAIREPGKPPWAGGWKVVGSKHPGWSQEKADRFKAKFGDCFPPGQCKKGATAPTTSPAIPRGD